MRIYFPLKITFQRGSHTKRDEREGKDGGRYATGLAWGQWHEVKNKRK